MPCFSMSTTRYLGAMAVRVNPSKCVWYSMFSMSYSLWPSAKQIVFSSRRVTGGCRGEIAVIRADDLDPASVGLEHGHVVDPDPYRLARPGC